MRSYERRVDATGSSDLEGELQTAVTVHLPDAITGPATIFFGWPGGGFGRRYFDVQVVPGYSQAAFHTESGDVFVSCDHLATGDSMHPADVLSLTYEQLAAANHATAIAILDQLRSGTFEPGIPPIDVRAAMGMGQSMGGCLLTVQQANHRTFDGVAFLGWSGIFTNFPSPDGTRVTYPMPRRGTDLVPIADKVLGVVAPDEEQYRFCFHYPGEDPALVEPDLASYRPYTGVVRGDERTPWGSATTPPCAITMMTDGAVAAEAAAIDVPVFVGCGERDTVPDPWAEPTAYRGSTEITISVTPEMAHMHNFARTRAHLWYRLANFAAGLNQVATGTAIDYLRR